MARNTNTDTPLPPDEPFFANPPDGAVLDYTLARTATTVKVTITDERGRVVRTLTSDPPIAATDVNTLDVPVWWIVPPLALDRSAGPHRVVWDLRTASPRAIDVSPPISATPHRTPLEPQGSVVPPGAYRIALDADGATSSATLVVRQDPRNPVADATLRAQFQLANAIAVALDTTYAAANRVRARDAALAARFERANGQLVQLLASVQSGDGAPTEVQRQTFRARQRAVDELVRAERRR